MSWSRRSRSSTGTSILTCLVIMSIVSISAVVSAILVHLLPQLDEFHDTVSNPGGFRAVLRLAENLAWPAFVSLIPVLICTIFLLIGMREGISTGGLSGMSVILIVQVVSIQAGCVYCMRYIGLVESLPASLIPHMSMVLHVLVSCIALELAAIGCFRITIYNFVTAGMIMGSSVGFHKAVEMGKSRPWFQAGDGIKLLMHASVNMIFWIGLVGLGSAMIARSKAGFSTWNHLAAFVIPLSAAALFGFTVETDGSGFMNEHEFIRISISVCIAVIVCLIAVICFRPLRLRLKPAEEEDDDRLRFAKSLMTRDTHSDSPVSSELPFHQI